MCSTNVLAPNRKQRNQQGNQGVKSGTKWAINLGSVCTINCSLINAGDLTGVTTKDQFTTSYSNQVPTNGIPSTLRPQQTPPKQRGQGTPKAPECSNKWRPASNHRGTTPGIYQMFITMFGTRMGMGHCSTPSQWTININVTCCFIFMMLSFLILAFRFCFRR